MHSPDRLARTYAYQVLLVDEFRRAGVGVGFLNRALGQSPEDDLLLQVQGMIAEYERAKIIGVIGVASAMRPASGGERAQWRPLRVPLCAQVRGGGQARYEIIPDEARVVRQVFAWVGQHRLTIGSL